MLKIYIIIFGVAALWVGVAAGDIYYVQEMRRCGLFSPSGFDAQRWDPFVPTKTGIKDVGSTRAFASESVGLAVAHLLAAFASYGAYSRYRVAVD